MATKFTENKTIVLAILEENYDSFINDTSEAHRVIKNVHKESPELFPDALSEQGYILKGKDRVSKKMGIQLRWIKTGNEIYRIRPRFVMPYMRAKTSEVENALLLIRFGVPFWVITLVFGRNAMFPAKAGFAIDTVLSFAYPNSIWWAQQFIILLKCQRT